MGGLLVFRLHILTISTFFIMKHVMDFWISGGVGSIMHQSARALAKAIRSRIGHVFNTSPPVLMP